MNISPGTDPVATLADAYIQAWSTTDAATRHDLVAAVYASDAEFFSSEDGDLRLTGRGQIEDNIGHVNDRDIRGHGLDIVHTATSMNHRMARVAWQMVTPDGDVALNGVNILVLDESSRILQDYIFIG